MKYRLCDIRQKKENGKLLIGICAVVVVETKKKKKWQSNNNIALDLVVPYQIDYRFAVLFASGRGEHEYFILMGSMAYIYIMKPIQFNLGAFILNT